MGKNISFRSVYIRIWAKSSIFPVCKNSNFQSFQRYNFVCRGPILFAGDQFCL